MNLGRFALDRAFIILISLALGICICIGRLFAESSPEQKSNSARAIIVGLPREKQDSFNIEMTKTDQKFRYLRSAKKLIKSGKLREALGVLDQGLIFLSEENMDPWLLRWTRADVYEMLEMKQELLGELDWLSLATQDSGTKLELATRKRDFLEKHPDL